MKLYLTCRQREVLQLLMPGDWTPLPKLIAVGDRLLATLLEKGWIERGSDVNADNIYRITEAGSDRCESTGAYKVTRHDPFKEYIERMSRGHRAIELLT